MTKFLSFCLSFTLANEWMIVLNCCFTKTLTDIDFYCLYSSRQNYENKILLIFLLFHRSFASLNNHFPTWWHHILRFHKLTEGEKKASSTRTDIVQVLKASSMTTLEGWLWKRQLIIVLRIRKISTFITGVLSSIQIII